VEGRIPVAGGFLAPSDRDNHRIRDGHATGRGSLVIAGTAGYSVGSLHIPGLKKFRPTFLTYPRILIAVGKRSALPL
jgi:hypothetical protein